MVYASKVRSKLFRLSAAAEKIFVGEIIMEETETSAKT